ncbi:MAG TPA: SDR family oxidoreductase [Bacteroidia bacterium]|jgi:NAD(P)-dependent dehydrogenase (short-subunit alcohol dehydrogenase family)|nr:SDR family oxidoreductase [Bacteroidia bacterium]
MRSLENKVALVTGAGSGMGKAIAALFASEGAKVVATDVNEKRLQELVNAIRSDKGEIISVTGDVSKEDDARKMIDAAMRKYEGIDVLVNNAGVLDNFMPVADATNEMWDHVMGVNINGPFYLCRLVVPIMLKQGRGSIVNISSVGGLNGSRAGVAYTTSKHALIGLSKNIAFMYGDKGIRCNVIAPGGVNTNIGEGMNPNALGYAKLSLGLGTNIRTGEPKEIAEVALFLAGEKSSLMNGAVVVADAGWTAY